MNKILMMAAATTCFAMVSCGGNKQAANDAAAADAEAPAVPEYTVVENEQIDLSQFPQDAEGYYVIFDGKDMKGWRGYGRDTIPARWVIDDESIHFIGSGGGEGQVGDGGDLVFSKKLKNFELLFDWKVAKGSNSGVFVLAQEIQGKDKDGNPRMEPI
ncbi:MAG: DUF1080 domain-containing protein, partial [Paramuribaculum sp.]|nr:DUF1080 domain-containing protein [Paramuribaculum sp.]